MSESRCKVCAHPERPQIDAAIASGMNNSVAAEKWGLSKDGVRRHRASHLSLALMAVTAQRETGGAVKAIDRAEALYSKAEGLLEAAQSEGKASLSLAAIRELRGIVELLAKLTGELDERPTVQVLNVTTSPEWAQVRTVLLVALSAYPEAHVTVAAALQELEA